MGTEPFIPEIPVKIIGVGNMFRRDDGLGIHVVQRLAVMKIPGLIVEEQSGEGASLLESFKAFPHVVIVDAVGGNYDTPGTIVRLDARRVEVPEAMFYCSSHRFSVAEAVEMGRILDVMPQRLVLYGIAGSDFSEGSGLSAILEDKVPELLSCILGELLTFRCLAGKVPEHRVQKTMN